MNRRAFFGLITGVLAAFGFKTKPIPLERLGYDVVRNQPITYDDVVKWGPGIKHPHWRVPQGRWTFVEDK